MVILYTLISPIALINWWPVMFRDRPDIATYTTRDLYYKPSRPVSISPVYNSLKPFVHRQGSYEYYQFWRDVESLSPNAERRSRYSYLRFWLKKPHATHGTNGAWRDYAFREKDVTEYVDCLRTMSEEWHRIRVRDRKGNYMIFTSTGDVWRCYGDSGKLFEIR